MKRWLPQKYTSRGVAVKQLDHINLFASDLDSNSAFMRQLLGCKLSEQIMLDSGKQGGAWLHLTNKAYQIAYTLDHTGAKGRLHHLTYNVENRESVLQAADVFLENGIFIEFTPSKHAIQQTFAMYVYEPGDTRIEICTGGYSIIAPDWGPITWTEAKRAKGQAWGNKIVETFHSYGHRIMNEQ